LPDFWQLFFVNSPSPILFHQLSSHSFANSLSTSTMTNPAATIVTKHTTKLATAVAAMRTKPSTLATLTLIVLLWSAAALVFVPAAKRVAKHDAKHVSARSVAQQSSTLHATEETEETEKNGKSDAAEEEDPALRLAREERMLRNPRTKSIPEDIQRRELVFVRSSPTLSARNASTNSKNATEGSGSLASEAWTQRGPYNVGGRTRAFAVDASNERVLVAGGISGGIWRSDDAGATWRKTTTTPDAPLPSNISSLVQDTRSGKTNVWYAATGEGWGNSASATAAPYRGDGVLKSTDGARTWTLLPSTATRTPQRYDQRFDYTWTLATNPANTSQDEVFAALFGCIKRSTDGGTTWRTVLGSDSITQPTTGRFTDVAVAPRSGVMYATISRADGERATSNGIFRSTDGVRWARISSALPNIFPTTTRRIVIAISPRDENEVYFLAETPGRGFEGVNDDETEQHSFWLYTYRAGDGSADTSPDNASWTEISDNLPRFTGAGLQGDYVSQASYDMVLRFKPDNADVLFMGGHNLYRSTDAFRTGFRNAWIGGYRDNTNFALRTGHHVDQHVIAFLPSNPNVMFTANDGGVFRTDNCLASNVAWTPLNNGYVTTQFYAIAIAPSTLTGASAGTPANASVASFVVGGLQDNGTWASPTNGGSSPQAAWRNLRSGDGGFTAVGSPQHSAGEQYVYISQQNGFIYRLRSDAAFSSFTGSTLIKPVGGTGFDFITPFALDPADTRVLYVLAGRTLWRQSNATNIPTGTLGTSSTGWASWLNLGRTLASGSTELLTALGASSGSSSGSSSGASSGSGSTSRLYVGTSEGRVLRIDNATTVTPAQVATQVQDVSDRQFPSGGNVICIAVDATDQNRALAVFSNYEVQSLFLTENGGQSWTAVGGNLEENADGSGAGPSCRWASVMNVGGALKVYVGTSAGLYSTDVLRGAATRWTQEGASVLGNAVVSMVCTRNSDGAVVAATHGSGVFSSIAEFTQTSITTDDVVLQQNFPNPVINGTTVRFKLPEPSVITLAVFDLQGKHVATLASETLSAGTYQRRWDGTSSDGAPVATGMYVYRLSALRNGTRVLRTGTLLVAR
jgi:hypothetical protein